MLFSTVFGAVALLAAEASAHGAVTSYVIDGTTYPGYVLIPLLQNNIYKSALQDITRINISIPATKVSPPLLPPKPSNANGPTTIPP